MIPRFRPMIGADEIIALFRPSKGAVRQFEKEFADRFNAVDAVSFPYGRSALWALFKSLEFSNVEIIIPPYTCSVVAHAISLSGNHPRFVDIRPSDFNMDLDLLSDAINERTRAIVATHIFGYPLDVDKLGAIVADSERRYGHKIWVIQDCAHSFGATWQGRPVSMAGDAALYGLNVSKILTSVFGGMLTFQDKELAERTREWRDEHFQRPGLFKSMRRRMYMLAILVAFNERSYGLVWWLQNRTTILDGLAKDYHLDDKIHFPPDFLDLMLDVEAAVGLVQLQKYDYIIERRRQNAQWYDHNLPRSDDWVLPPIVDGATYSHYVIRTDRRDELTRACAERGVELGRVIDYSVPELQSYRSGSDCPNSAAASRTALNLPVNVSDDTLYRVLDALREAK